MPVYVSMLRGINVGAHHRIKMERLRECFEPLGFEQVKTYIQSGNVVFKAATMASSAMSQKIEKKLLGEFGFAIPVICRTADEMNAILAGNPFLKQRGIDRGKLHVMFLSGQPLGHGLKKMRGFCAAVEKIECKGCDIYLFMPNGLGESKLMRASLEKMLGVVPTTRNWNTVNQLVRMCEECSG